MMASVIAERGRGWTGIIEPNVSFIVVENGRITDVVYSEAANGPIQPTKYDETPALVIPRRPMLDDPSFFNSVACGYTGPVTTGDVEWSFTGPVGGSTEPLEPEASPRTLSGDNTTYRRFT